MRTCGIDPSLLAEGKELVAWDEEKAQKAIEEFCKGDWTVDPAVHVPTPGGFSQYGDQGESEGMPYREYRYPDDSTDHITNIYVVFNESPPPDCAEGKLFKIGDDQDKCKKKLNQVMNDPDHCELLHISQTFISRRLMLGKVTVTPVAS